MAWPLAPLRSEHSINCEHFRMSKKESINLAKLVRDERQKWQDDNLLASGAFRDFQKLCDEARKSRLHDVEKGVGFLRVAGERQ
jgi:hypothetical protein